MLAAPSSSWPAQSRLRALVEIQSQYAKKASDTWVAEASKLGEMYAAVARDAYKPVAKAVAKRALLGHSPILTLKERSGVGPPGYFSSVSRTRSTGRPWHPPVSLDYLSLPCAAVWYRLPIRCVLHLSTGSRCPTAARSRPLIMSRRASLLYVIREKHETGNARSNCCAGAL